ncbi:STAS domain-containing protein [Mycobacterium aquaticum]|uniref:Anti-anti-sigma factor n=1 Tax=Mycobacterium aquaticum TaxID=1927124 RepID=A0A1X0ARL5_9MYCO|nr:STAS domain-containing protein [Mycobacterium aquaticum]ORA32669.1 anti-anti-sigma factor [Mycobacterium aquaticum]
MTITTNTPASDGNLRYVNQALVCDGASIRSQCRQLATVVTIKGDVNTFNIDTITAYVRRSTLPEKPLVVDMSGVTGFASQAISLFYDVDERCGALGVDWAVVASDAVIAELDDIGVPVTASVAEALHHFAEGNLARRRLLPLLTKSA